MASLAIQPVAALVFIVIYMAGSAGPVELDLERIFLVTGGACQLVVTSQQGEICFRIVIKSQLSPIMRGMT